GRGRALAGGQPTLGGQLGVGVADRAAGQAEVGRQRPGGRQPVACAEAARPDGLAEGVLEPGPSTFAPVQVDVEVAGSRPPFCQRNGPYLWTSARVGSVPWYASPSGPSPSPSTSG